MTETEALRAVYEEFLENLVIRLRRANTEQDQKNSVSNAIYQINKRFSFDWHLLLNILKEEEEELYGLLVSCGFAETDEKKLEARLLILEIRTDIEQLNKKVIWLENLID